MANTTEYPASVLFIPPIEPDGLLRDPPTEWKDEIFQGTRVKEDGHILVWLDEVEYPSIPSFVEHLRSCGTKITVPKGKNKGTVHFLHSMAIPDFAYALWGEENQELTVPIGIKKPCSHLKTRNKGDESCVYALWDLSCLIDSKYLKARPTGDKTVCITTRNVVYNVMKPVNVIHPLHYKPGIFMTIDFKLEG